MSIVIVFIFILIVSALIFKFHPARINSKSFYEKENLEDLAPESAVIVEFHIDENAKKISKKSKKKYYYHSNKKNKKYRSAVDK